MSGEQEWLKAFQQRLDDDARHAGGRLAQAQPVYYAIMDQRDAVVRDGCGDYTMIAGDDGLRSPREWLAGLRDNEQIPVEHMPRLLDALLDGDDQAIIDYADSLDDETTVVECVRQEYITTDAMFLTLSEAERHLKANAHHYAHDAHTYAMTAWRSPEVERLLTILHSIDFDKSTIIIKEES